MKVLTPSPRETRSLARRLSGWTSNLLATGIVLAVAVGFGRQMAEWWGVDERAIEAGGPVVSSTQPARQTAVLELGGSGRMVQRQSLRGSREQALAQMREACRQIVQSAAAPSETPNARERAFLQRTAEQTPIDSDLSQGWQLHQFDGAFPMIVGTRNLPATTSLPQGSQDGELAQPKRRVLVWSLGVAADENQWTLYTWQAGSTADNSLPSAELPLPPGCRRTLALAGGMQESTVGFAGIGIPEEAQRHFDRLARQRNWTLEGWRQNGGVWNTRYISAKENLTIDVQFAAEQDQRLVGLIVTTRATHPDDAGH